MKRLAWLLTVAALTGATAGAQDLQRGITLYNQGNFAGAEPVFQAAVPDLEARAWLAATLVRLKRYAEVEAQANPVLAANPAQPRAVAALGEALVMQEQPDKAIARMSQALEKKSDLAYAYYWRGQAYQRKKQVARMVDDYKAFLRLQPDAPEAPALKVLLGSLQ
jgi:tetratricopeptide (TPR) repeat protein